MCLDAAKELEVRATLETVIALQFPRLIIPNVATGKNVFATPYVFSSKEDFAARVGVSGANNIRSLEAKFCQLGYLNFTETGEGSADCPVINLNYNIFLFLQFREVRADQTHSHNDFVALVMDFVKKFKRGYRLTDKARVVSLTEPDFAVFDQTSRYLPGVKGSFTDLRLVVEVR